MAATTITVGICAHNEGANIGHLLDNILYHQPLGENYLLKDILVVSSGSTDKTNQIVSEKAEKDARITTFIQETRNGKANAQNVILSHSNGEMLVLVSADALPEPGALLKLVSALHDGVGGVSARAVPVNGVKGVVNFASTFIWELMHATNSYLSGSGELSLLGGDMIAIKSGIVKAIPGFIINDDAYLGVAIKRHGYKIINVPSSIIKIYGPSTISDYIRQRERVLFGHSQIERSFGQAPSTFEKFMLRKPIMAAHIFVKVCSKFSPAQLLKMPFVMSLELTALISSKIKGKDYSTWNIISTTKQKIPAVRGSEIANCLPPPT
jgi:cellulose synthase/poly-beta-1,6-N-acetylglucosamine synthase-like glycosyltransferase